MGLIYSLIIEISPTFLNPERDLNKINSDRLHRWAAQLMSFRYMIHHITGELNHWPDLLSRWGSPARCLRTLKLKVVSPPNQEFKWPTYEEILQAQQDNLNVPEKLRKDQESGLLKTEKAQVWIAKAILL